MAVPPRSEALSLRIATRVMTPHSLNLVVHLYARAPLGAVRVSVVAADPRLAIRPAVCALQVLAPPVVHPPQGARFPLPAIPLCSFVLRATTPARYALTLRVRDAAPARSTAWTNASMKSSYAWPRTRSCRAAEVKRVGQ